MISWKTQMGTVQTVGVGCTVRAENKIVQVMSDVWDNGVVVYFWDMQTHTLKDMTFVYGMDIDFEWKVDATDDVVQDMFDTEFKQQIAVQTSRHDSIIKQINKGDTVKVVKGNHDRGAIGKVFAMKSDSYRQGYSAVTKTKLGIALDDETIEVTKNGKTFTNYKNAIWIWEHNCEKQNVVPLMSREEIRDAAFESAIAVVKKMFGK